MIRANENGSYAHRGEDRPDFTQGIAVDRRTFFARVIDLCDRRLGEIVAFKRPPGEHHRLWLVAKAEELNAENRRQRRA